MYDKMQLFALFLVIVMVSMCFAPLVSCDNSPGDTPLFWDDKPSPYKYDYYPVCIEGHEFYENSLFSHIGKTFPNLDDDGKPVKCGKDAVERRVLRK